MRAGTGRNPGFADRSREENDRIPQGFVGEQRGSVGRRVSDVGIVDDRHRGSVRALTVGVSGIVCSTVRGGRVPATDSVGVCPGGSSSVTGVLNEGASVDDPLMNRRDSK